MPDATPRPCRLVIVGHEAIVEHDAGETLCSCGSTDCKDQVTAKRRIAKAKMIVRAVNSHDAIVAALERAQQDINWMLNNRQFLNPDTFDYLDAALAQAQEPAR